MQIHPTDVLGQSRVRGEVPERDLLLGKERRHAVPGVARGLQAAQVQHGVIEQIDAEDADVARAEEACERSCGQWRASTA